MLPRGERGDDILANMLLLCGSGTSGCHGAWHGNPYVAQKGHWVLDVERRDRAWVGQRIGEHIRRERLDTILYLTLKLGRDAAEDYLRKHYS